VGVALIGVLAWFVLRSSDSDDAADNPGTTVPVAADEGPDADVVAGGANDETVAVDIAAAEDEPPTTDGPRTADTTAAAAVDTDDPGAADTTAAAAVDTDPPADETADTEPPVATEPAAPAPATQPPADDTADAAEAPAATAPPGGADGSYPTLPDGSPAPVVAVFGEDQITLTGAVRDEAAKDRLQALAVANAKPGQATNIANFVAIDPDVPAGVGVRVVELTSVRFPEGSAEILPAHAQELDRVVAIMNALPDVTALVIGHADQRGDAGRNYVLSAARAEAVVNYLAFSGVTPDRLASRAVGDTDLLTLNNDDAALALNRRTEFVFYGLLLE
jgi:outer membrane protein OmpA-like peptidoglycan-associated protein